jgi:hypothetical protein
MSSVASFREFLREREAEIPGRSCSVDPILGGVYPMSARGPHSALRLTGQQAVALQELYRCGLPRRLARPWQVVTCSHAPTRRRIRGERRARDVFATCVARRRTCCFWMCPFCVRALLPSEATCVCA